MGVENYQLVGGYTTAGSLILGGILSLYATRGRKKKGRKEKEKIVLIFYIKLIKGSLS